MDLGGCVSLQIDLYEVFKDFLRELTESPLALTKTADSIFVSASISIYQGQSCFQLCFSLIVINTCFFRPQDNSSAMFHESVFLRSRAVRRSCLCGGNNWNLFANYR